MKKIKCKICGADVDAELGICPNCGAMYYVLDDKDESVIDEPDNTQPVDGGPMPNQDNVYGGAFTPQQSRAEQINSAANDELFYTRRWNTNNPAAGSTPTQPPVQRPVRPARPQPPSQQQRINAMNQQQTQRPQYQNSNGYKPEPPRNNSKRPFIIAGIALVAVLVLIISIMSDPFDFDKNSEKTEMPSVVGLSMQTAVSLLEDSLKMEVTVMHEDDEAPEDEVINQTVKEGSIIEEGDKVTLIISNGPEEEDEEEVEYVTVPQLVGLEYDMAKGIIEKYNLVVTRAEDVYSPKQEGEVLKQNPLAGAKVIEGDIITLTVSKGEEPPPAHVITVTAGNGGSISPKGSVDVEEGENASFTITADEGYEIREVKVDGESIGAVSEYTFKEVTGNHTIYAIFEEIQEPEPEPTPEPTPEPDPAPEQPEEPETPEQPAESE